MIRALYFIGLSVLVSAFPVSSVAEEKQMIAGAGPSTTIVQLFVDHFGKTPAASRYMFEVPPRSAKHAGGIRASDKFLFGRTGRPLNDEERNMNKDEIFLGRIPIGFATGKKTSVSKLSLAQLRAIYEGKINNWKEVGGVDAPIVLAGREPYPEGHSRH